MIAAAALAATIVCPTNRRARATTTGSPAARGNTIYAEKENDRIAGREGDDALKGGEGRDEVYGGPGDDLVRGGIPARPNDGVQDVLDCGAGVDAVYFGPGQDQVKNCEAENPSQP